MWNPNVYGTGQSADSYFNRSPAWLRFFKETNIDSFEEEISSISSKSEKKPRRSCPQSVVWSLVGTVSVILLLGVACVPLILYLIEKDEYKYYKADSQLVLQGNYRGDLGNLSSNTSILFQKDFCKLMENSQGRYTDAYKGCIVSNIRNGSIIVEFTMFYYTTSIIQTTEVQTEIIATVKTSSTTVTIAVNFTVEINTLKINVLRASPAEYQSSETDSRFLSTSESIDSTVTTKATTDSTETTIAMEDSTDTTDSTVDSTDTTSTPDSTVTTSTPDSTVTTTTVPVSTVTTTITPDSTVTTTTPVSTVTTTTSTPVSTVTTTNTPVSTVTTTTAPDSTVTTTTAPDSTVTTTTTPDSTVTTKITTYSTDTTTTIADSTDPTTAMAVSTVTTTTMADSIGTTTTMADSIGTTTTMADSIGTTTTMADSIGTTTTMADFTVTTTNLADSINSTTMADSIVTTTMADSTDTTTTMADSTDTTTTMADSIVTTTTMADFTVTTTTMADSTDTTTTMADSIVTTTTMADSTDTTTTMTDSIVTTTTMADSLDTTATMADSIVTTTTMADSTVTTTMTDSTVTTTMADSIDTTNTTADSTVTSTTTADSSDVTTIASLLPNAEIVMDHAFGEIGKVSYQTCMIEIKRGNWESVSLRYKENNKDLAVVQRNGNVTIYTTGSFLTPVFNISDNGSTIEAIINFDLTNFTCDQSSSRQFTFVCSVHMANGHISNISGDFDIIAPLPEPEVAGIQTEYMFNSTHVFARFRATCNLTIDKSNDTAQAVGMQVLNSTGDAIMSFGDYESYNVFTSSCGELVYINWMTAFEYRPDINMSTLNCYLENYVSKKTVFSNNITLLFKDEVP